MDSGSLVYEDVLRVDGSVYGIECVKRAAYRFIDRFATDIRVDGSDIVCRLTFTPPVAADVASSIVIDLRKELMDQGLRQSISAETASLRSAILALAFAPAKLEPSE